MEVLYSEVAVSDCFFSDALKNVILNLLSVLSGNVVNIQTGHWVGKQSGLGAGSMPLAVLETSRTAVSRGSSPNHMYRIHTELS